MGHRRMLSFLCPQQLCPLMLTAHALDRVLMPKSPGGQPLPAEVTVKGLGSVGIFTLSRGELSV